MTTPLSPRLRRHASVDGDDTVRVLLLHGMGGGVSGWDPLDSLLDGRLETWDVELPWSISGDASWTRQADIGRWPQQALELTEQACGAEIDLVVAHSFAANAVLELAASRGVLWSYPTVLISPFYRASPEEFDWPIMNLYVERFQQMLDAGIRLRAGERLDARTRQDMSRRLCDLLGPYTWLRFFDTFLRTPLLDLVHVDVPCVVVAGDSDEGAQPDGARALAEALPRGRFNEIADCGHFPMIEQPGSLAASIDEIAAALHQERSLRLRYPSRDRGDVTQALETRT